MTEGRVERSETANEDQPGRGGRVLRLLIYPYAILYIRFGDIESVGVSLCVGGWWRM